MGAHEMEKILVIDDNEVICDMLYDVLNEWGFCVEKAYQGMKALPLVDEFQPDLVLLDVMLPGMNGFEICRRIKSDPEKEHIAVILLTVLSDVGDRMQAVNVGADLFLSKPVNYKELRKQIGYLLGKKKRLADMEKAESVCQFILNLVRYMDSELYSQAKEVKRYCDRLLHILNFSENERVEIELGIAFHVFGEFVMSHGITRDELEDMIAPLKLSGRIVPYLRDEQSETFIDPDLKNVKLLRIVEKFCEFKREGKNNEEALSALAVMVPRADKELLDGLKRQISAEKFMENLKSGKESI